MWNRSYRVDDVTRGIAVRRAVDDPNGYVLLGHTDTLTETAPSIFVMRTDPLGNPIWTNTYGRGLGRRFEQRSEIRTCGTGYVICGTVLAPAEGGLLGFLLRIDAAGGLMWMRFYRQMGPAFDLTHFNDVEHTASGFVVTGDSLSQAPPGMFQNSTETLVLTTDDFGNVVWAKQYPFLQGGDAGKSIAVTPLGYAVVGNRDSFGIPATQLFALDSVGNLSWLREISLFVDGGSNTQNQEANGSLLVLPGGDLVFPGGNLASEAGLLSFDNVGDLVAGHSYGPVAFQQGASAVMEPAGAGITFVGPCSTGVSNDYYLARTDSNFLTQCTDAPYVPSITTPPVTPIDIVYVSQSVQEVGPLAPVVGPLLWNEQIQCQSSPCLESLPITCSVSGLTVNLSWPPLPGTLAMAELWRDGSLLAIVTGTSFADTPSFGSHTYELRLYDIDPSCPTASAFCSALVGISIPVVNVTDVIAVPWKPVPDGPIICWADHLISKGRDPRIVTTLDLVSPDLGSAVPGVTPIVWLSLGQFPEFHTLTQDEGQILADFLAAGGSLYIEGGDVAFGSQTALAGIDGVIAIDDGAIDDQVPALTGLDSGLGVNASQLSAPYRGSGLRVDHLAPDGNGAAPVFQNAGGAGQTTAVFYDASVAGAGNHRVLTSSTLFEEYGGSSTLLLDAILDGLSPPAAAFLRGDSNGDGAIDIGDPIYDLAYLFSNGPSVCLDAQDNNDDGAVDIGDPVYSLAFNFSGGPPPLAPWPACGADPSADALDCQSLPNCP